MEKDGEMQENISCFNSVADDHKNRCRKLSEFDEMLKILNS
jgi:hypothetical protein